MKFKFLLLAIIISLTTFSHADEISDQVKVGMSKSEVTQIFGSTPDSEECTTIATLSKCTTVWKKGIISKSTYTITFVLDKVVSVTVNNIKLLG
ncbi:MAG: hypothetical protein KA797_07845 [Chitinophagales bacterium]|nr:hypothetical protein [Chitinophagales bacterium]